MFNLRRAKNILSEQSLKLLYYSTFHCHLIYCILIYSSACPTSLKNIIIKQKKAIRCVADAKYNAHTGPLFKQLKILPFDSLVTFSRLQFISDFKHNHLPKSFCNVWQINEDRQLHHVLRNANEFYIPRARTSLVGRLPLCTLPTT